MENSEQPIGFRLHGLHVVAIIFAVFFTVSGISRYANREVPPTMISVGALTAELRSPETEIATEALKYLDEQAPMLEQTFRLKIEKQPTIRFSGLYNFDSGSGRAHYHHATDTICVKLNPPAQWVTNPNGNVGITLVHEYTHFLIDQLATQAGGGIVPLWLHEGLAGYHAHDRVGTMQADALVAIDDLNDVSESVLYEESFMLVRYMVETYGEDKVLALIDAYGKGVKAPLEAVLRTDEDELLQRLRASLPR